MSIYKNFRNYRKVEENWNSLTTRYDQPTYLSFKLSFAEMEDRWYNGAGGAWDSGINFDRMPHPLFMIKSEKPITTRQRYSAVDYLYDANEITRARMLESFQTKFMQLQNNYQWYFQKIDGVSDLLEIDPKKGIRITQDKRLTITALEGVDLRMSHLMNLYRKAAWDDTYQRWVLPDMMRYFTLKIYVSEFRTFQTPNTTTGWGGVDSRQATEEGQLLLHVLDNWIPTWVINCEMCEFDLEGLDFNFLKDLGIDDAPNEAGMQFKIKVGKIYEQQHYPMFKNQFLIDRAINGFDRSQETDSRLVSKLEKIGDKYIVTKKIEEADFDSTDEAFNNNRMKYGSNLRIAQDLPSNGAVGGDQIVPQVDTDSTHISGTPFNQGLNDKEPIPTQILGKGAGDTDIGSTEPDGKWLNFADGKVRIGENAQRDGWLGNALKFGESFAANAANKVIDKAKVTPIPALGGLTFSEVAAAIKSKDIITALGLVKKAVDQTVNEVPPPSALLERTPGMDLSEQVFMNILKDLSESDATDDDPDKIDNLLRAAASEALGDNTILTAVLDYSRATNLTAQGETNIPAEIEGGTNFAAGVNESTQGDLSHATNLGGPGQQNIERDIEKGGLYAQAVENSVQGDLSHATQAVGPGESDITQDIGEGNSLSYEESVSDATRGDKSLATNIIAEGEGNIQTNIQDGLEYGDNISEATQGDKSLGTDLTAEGQGNVPTSIEGGLEYAGNISEATQGNKSLATTDEPKVVQKRIIGEIIEGVPTSKATSGQIIKG